jgi:hypothetical protein
MNTALFVTIWLALVAFAAAEAGRRPAFSGRAPARWLDAVSLAGLALLLVHIALAYGVRHGWSHDAAVRATAQQTAAVYGIDWGGGIYINYLFALVWAIDAWQWSVSPAAAAARRPAILWALRAFYGVIIANGAVIFVPGARRWIGIAITLGLIWIWRPLSRGARQPPVAPPQP